MRLLAHLYMGRDKALRDTASFSNELFDHVMNVDQEIATITQHATAYTREDIVYIHHALKLIMRSYAVLSYTHSNENISRIKKLLNAVVDRFDQLLDMTPLRKGYRIIVGATAYTNNIASRN